MDSAALAKNLAERMQARGLTAKGLSKAAGLNDTYVRALLTQRSRNPRMDHLSRLAAVLGCTVIDLTGTGSGAGMAEAPAGLVRPPPAPPVDDAVDTFALVTTEVEMMLRQEGVTASTGEVLQLARKVWQDMLPLGALEFRERLAFVLAERRHKVRQHRAAMLQD